MCMGCQKISLSIIYTNGSMWSIHGPLVHVGVLPSAIRRSMMHLQALKISKEFLLQGASDIQENNLKALELKLAIINKKCNLDFL